MEVDFFYISCLLLVLDGIVIFRLFSIHGFHKFIVLLLLSMLFNIIIALGGTVSPSFALPIITFTLFTYLWMILELLKQHKSLSERAGKSERQFIDAIESISEAFFLFDANDRLVLTNQRYRDIMKGCENVLVPGTPFNALIREAVAKKVVMLEPGCEEDWIAERIRQHQNPKQRTEQHLRGDRWVLAAEYRTHDGGTVGIRTDITDLKKISQAVGEGERRFRDIAQSASDWFWETNADLQFVFATGRVFDVMGVNPSYLIGKEFQEIANLSREPERWRALFALMQAQKNFRDFVVKHVNANDGKTLWLRLNGAPVVDDKGEFVGYRGAASDVSAEIIAKNRADIAQDQLISAIESISEGFALWDKEDRLVLYNRKYRDLFPEGERYVTSGIKFAELARVIAYSGHINEANFDPEKWIKERVEQHKSGKGGVIRLYGNNQWLLINEQTTNSGFTVGVYTDITLIKNQEKAIEAHSLKLDCIIDNLPQGVAVFDKNLRLEAINQVTQKLYNLPSHMCKKGTNFWNLTQFMIQKGDLGRGKTEQIIKRYREILDNVLTSPVEHTLDNGRTVEIRSAHMPDGGTIATYSDISDRKAVEAYLTHAKEEAEKANLAKTRFLAITSHELRTPLNAIIGFGEIMQAEMFGPLGNPRYKEYVKDSLLSAHHLLSIINDILDMSKADAGKLDLNLEAVDVFGTVEQALRIIVKKSESQKLKITSRISADLPPVLADPKRLLQILLNLLSNAVKFTPEPGEVIIDGEVGGSELVISVSDSGIGMNPEEIGQALEPFAQTDNNLNRKYEGTGLGLPLSKALVELHKGRLSIESSKGKGTRVSFTIPLRLR